MATANHLFQSEKQFNIATADASGYDVAGSRSTETVQGIVNRLRVMAGVDTLQVLRNQDISSMMSKVVYKLVVLLGIG